MKSIAVVVSHRHLNNGFGRCAGRLPPGLALPSLSFTVSWLVGFIPFKRYFSYLRPCYHDPKSDLFGSYPTQVQTRLSTVDSNPLAPASVPGSVIPVIYSISSTLGPYPVNGCCRLPTASTFKQPGFSGVFLAARTHLIAITSKHRHVHGVHHHGKVPVNNIVSPYCRPDAE
jgi:hypothetical protein